MNIRPCFYEMGNDSSWMDKLSISVPGLCPPPLINAPFIYMYMS